MQSNPWILAPNSSRKYTYMNMKDNNNQKRRKWREKGQAKQKKKGISEWINKFVSK